MSWHGTLAATTLAVAVAANPPSPDWTPAEREYLAATSEIRVCADPDYRPFEFVDDDGRHQGIAADLLDEIARMTGLSMRLVPTRDWSETLERARAGDCDVVGMLNETPARAGYLAFTRPYVTFDNAIVTHRPAYHRGLASLAGRTVALPEGYRILELVEAEHPGIQVVLVPNVEAALHAVSRGAAYATLVNHQRLVREVQRLQLGNIHFAGEAELPDHYRIGVRLDDPVLLAVMDKALAHLPDERLGAIMERWYVVPVESAVPWRLILAMAGAAAVFMAFLLLNYYHRQRYTRLLERKNQDLERLSTTDALTRVANRRSLTTRLEAEVERSRRYARPLSVIVFDVDHFKDINDRHGHATGDTVLIELAALVQQSRRAADHFGRWGGEEFLVVCPETRLEEACIVAERLRDAVEDHEFHEGLRLTISIGVAELAEADSWATLVHRADEALYHAKAAGRNTVETGSREAGDRVLAE